MPKSNDISDLLPKRGRPPKIPIMFEVVRDLEAEEVLSLSMGLRPALAPPPLQRVREIHKQTARMMANGHSDMEIALTVGRSVQRIRDYRLDPMMKDLIAYYESQREELDLRVESQVRSDLIDIAQITTHEILDRLEDPAEIKKIPTGELRQLNEMALDRTVAPKNNPQQNTQPPPQITFNIIGPNKAPKLETLNEIEPETQPVSVITHEDQNQ